MSSKQFLNDNIKSILFYSTSLLIKYEFLSMEKELV